MDPNGKFVVSPRMSRSCNTHSQLVLFGHADFLASEGLFSPDAQENPTPLENPLFDFAVAKQTPVGHRKVESSVDMPMQDNTPQNSHSFRNLEMSPPLLEIQLSNQKEKESRHKKVREILLLYFCL